MTGNRAERLIGQPSWLELDKETAVVARALDEAAMSYAANPDKQKIYDLAAGYFLGHEEGNPYVAACCLAEELGVIRGETLKTADARARQMLIEKGNNLLKVFQRLEAEIMTTWWGKANYAMTKVSFGLV